MTSDPKPAPAHECESWQIRRHPSGGRYCAACGALQVRPPIPAADADRAVAFVEEVLQVKLAPWQVAQIKRPRGGST